MRTVEQLRARAMGTEVHIIVVGGPLGLARDAVSHVHRLEARWSRFLPASDISRANAAGGAPVLVHPDTLTLVATAADAWRRTAGRFDPTVHDAMLALGYDRDFGEIADGAAAHARDASPGRSPGCGGIVLDLDSSVLRLPVGVRFDPGGIGKGLAADLVAESLVAQGARGALVDIGGDIRAAGEPPGAEGWTIALDDPGEPARALGVLAFAVGGDVAVATSSTLGRRWRRGTTDVHHLIDPSAGAPMAGGRVAATVIARRAWLADVACKVVLDGGAWPENLGPELPALVVDADGSLDARAGFATYLHESWRAERCLEVG